MSRHKPLFVLLLATITIILAYGSPRIKYQGTGILENITLPAAAGDWNGEDVRQEMNLGQDRYFYIHGVKTKKYTNAKGDVVYFTVMEAGNFHHPRTCFSSSGYEGADMADTALETSGGNFQVSTLFFKKKGEELIVMYWICLNKERVDWTRQKIKEFWYSLVGGGKAGLCMRLDIPASQDNFRPALSAAQNFIKTISASIPSETAQYLFGKNRAIPIVK